MGGLFVGKSNPRSSSVPPVGEWATNDGVLSLVVVWLMGKRQRIRRGIMSMRHLSGQAAPRQGSKTGLQDRKSRERSPSDGIEKSRHLLLGTEIFADMLQPGPITWPGVASTRGEQRDEWHA